MIRMALLFIVCITSALSQTSCSADVSLWLHDSFGDRATLYPGDGLLTVTAVDRSTVRTIKGIKPFRIACGRYLIEVSMIPGGRPERVAVDLVEGPNEVSLGLRVGKVNNDMRFEASGRWPNFSPECAGTVRFVPVYSEALAERTLLRTDGVVHFPDIALGLFLAVLTPKASSCKSNSYLAFVTWGKITFDKQVQIPDMPSVPRRSPE